MQTKVTYYSVARRWSRCSRQHRRISDTSADTSRSRNWRHSYVDKLCSHTRAI